MSDQNTILYDLRLKLYPLQVMPKLKCNHPQLVAIQSIRTNSEKDRQIVLATRPEQIATAQQTIDDELHKAYVDSQNLIEDIIKSYDATRKKLLKRREGVHAQVDKRITKKMAELNDVIKECDVLEKEIMLSEYYHKPASEWNDDIIALYIEVFSYHTLALRWTYDFDTRVWKREKRARIPGVNYALIHKIMPMVMHYHNAGKLRDPIYDIIISTMDAEMIKVLRNMGYLFSRKSVGVIVKRIADINTIPLNELEIKRKKLVEVTNLYIQTVKHMINMVTDIPDVFNIIFIMMTSNQFHVIC